MHGAELIPLLRDRPQVEGKATAYVCENFTCKQPVNTASELASQLQIKPLRNEQPKFVCKSIFRRTVAALLGKSTQKAQIVDSKLLKELSLPVCQTLLAHGQHDASINFPRASYSISGAERLRPSDILAATEQLSHSRNKNR